MASSTEILASLDYNSANSDSANSDSARGDSEGIDQALRFLKRTRSELRDLRWVRIWPDRLEVIDINLDAFEIRGLGYLDQEIATVLDAVNTVYDRTTLHDPTDHPYKEYKTGRRRPWAEDRVM